MIVESDARYDMETAGMPEDMRPPKKDTIEIYRVSTNWRKGDRPVGTARQFEVTKTESAEWPHWTTESIIWLSRRAGIRVHA